MNNIQSIALNALRTLLSGEDRNAFVFEAPRQKTVKGLDSTNLYLHVPFCRNHSYEMVSVWGFRKKSGTVSFSSVSRDNFIGLGPGSASKLHDVFRFNTFDLDAYLEACNRNQSACSLEMPLSANMETLYRLYWRFYEGRLPCSILNSDLKRRKLWRFILGCLRQTGHVLFNRAESTYSLTERGAFWIHLLQNYYILNYIDRVWRTSMATSNPPRIELS